MFRKPANTVVVSDLDSTLCDTQHRHHLAPTQDPNSTWRAFESECLDDSPILGTVTALRLLSKQHRIHLVSGGRSGDQARRYTWLWVARYGVPAAELRLRIMPSEADLSNEDLKVRYIHELYGRGLEPVLFFEDWEPAAKAIERAGVPVVMVNPRYDGKLVAGPGESYVAGLA